MNIAKQRSFLESHQWAVAIVGLLWLGMNPVFGASDLDISDQGPAVLRGPASELQTIEASTAEQTPAINNTPTQKANTSGNNDNNEAPINNIVISSNGTSARHQATDSPSSPASTGNQDSTNDGATTTTTTDPSTDESVPATNVNQQMMARPDFVDPKVERNDIHVASIDNENFEFGLFVGMFSTEDFGTNPVYGLKLAYHVNEAVFFEVATGISKTQRTSAEEILNVDFISETDRELSYYNFSFGYNALPSETYFGEGWAFHSAIYVIGGAGFTEFAGDSFFTLNFGVGYRFLVTDWLALHLDVRDHLFEMDLLGKKKTTQNIELSTGVSFFF